MVPKNSQEKKIKYCHFCRNNRAVVDYKDTHVLRRFVSSYMKIGPKRRTGLCSWHQRKVSKAIKQARITGLMAFVPK